MNSYTKPEVKSLTTDRVVELMGPVSCGSTPMRVTPHAGELPKLVRPGGSLSLGR